MKKLKNIFLILALGSFMLPLLNSCHKYPEDPFISLRRPEKRLVSKTWHLTSYKINGIDSIAKFKIVPADSNGWISTPIINFGAKADNYVWRAYPTCDNGESWKIEENQLKLGYNYGYCPHLPIAMFPTTVWKILELYKSTFKISTSYNNKYYELLFEGK